MKKLNYIPMAITVGTLLVSCGGSDGDGDSYSFDYKLPPALKIDSTNAEPAYNSVKTNFDLSRENYLSYKGGIVVNNRSSLTNAFDFLNQVIMTRHTAGKATLSDPVAVTTSDSIDETCSGGGKIQGSVQVDDSYPLYSESGSITFDKCAETGITMDGRLRFSNQENSSTDAFSDSISGDISISRQVNGSETISIGMVGMNFAETGNSFDHTYTISAMDMSFGFSNSSLAFSVSISLDEDIVENTGDTCPDRGTVRLTGSNGTYLTATYNGSEVIVSENGNPGNTFTCI
jgi:hypothetical protein